MKLGKEIQFYKDENIKVKIGTVNNADMKSLYVTICSWLKPKFETIEEYKPSVRKLDKVSSKVLEKNLDGNAFNKQIFISNMDIREKINVTNKKIFGCFEYNIFTKKKMNIKSPEVTLLLNKIINDFKKEVVYENSEYEFFVKNED